MLNEPIDVIYGKQDVINKWGKQLMMGTNLCCVNENRTL